jgi:hypothetical protein
MIALDVALEWAARGLTPIPCWPKTKIPIHEWGSWRGQTPDRATLKRWFNSPHVNVAVLTGHSILVIDFDVRDAYDLWRARFPDVVTRTHQTARGVHVWFRVDVPIATHHRLGCDIKAEGGYVLVPPSLHPSGVHYVTLCDAPIAQLPEALIDTVLPLRPILPERQCGERKYSGTGPGLVQAVKETFDIVDLLATVTSPRQRNGPWYIMRCPMAGHTDRKPSFWANRDQGLAQCFNLECRERNGGKAFDVIGLFARLNNIDNSEATYRLAHQARLI